MMIRAIVRRARIGCLFQRQLRSNSGQFRLAMLRISGSISSISSNLGCPRSSLPSPAQYLALEQLMRARTWLGIFIGSAIGGFVPELWGAGMVSYSSVLLSGAGAFVGLWIGYRMS